MSCCKIASAIFKRELLINWRHKSAWFQPILFYIIVITLFSISLEHYPNLLILAAPAIVWVAVILAVLLSVPTIFLQDYHDGSLELVLLSPISKFFIITNKILAHWCMTCLPLILLTPVIALFLPMATATWQALALSLLIGTPILTMIGAIAAALTVGLTGASMLLALILLPLYVPVMIFGNGLVAMASQGLPWIGLLAMLLAMLIFSIVIAPAACIFALKLGMN